MFIDKKTTRWIGTYLLSILCIPSLEAQTADTIPLLNMEAMAQRALFQPHKLPISIGGAMEVHTEYSQTDGTADAGYAFVAPRMNLYFVSQIARKIKFHSEIGLEKGSQLIYLERATTDIQFHPYLNLSAGILFNPIGAFNQNHDSPRWDFIHRPSVSTNIIPSTFSNAGLGFHGKMLVNQWVMGYEAYLTNGLNDKIISNTENRTLLSAGKTDPEKWERSNSGLPAFSGKLAFRNRVWGEIGLSCFTGIFNKWRQDGLHLDEKQRVRIFALDFNTSWWNNRLQIRGEAAKVFVTVPATYIQSYGREQSGIFVDIVGVVLKRKILDWDKAQLNIGIRSEWVDYNQERFTETGGKIGDEMWAITPSLAFRPAETTVFRLNYRYQQHRDLLGNPDAQKTGVFQLGLATYF